MANTLNGGRTYYVRARHKATNGLVSEWTPPIRFTTSSASVAKPTLRTALPTNGWVTGYSVPNEPIGSGGYSNGTYFSLYQMASPFTATSGLLLKHLVVEWGDTPSFGQTITVASDAFSLIIAPSKSYWFRMKYVSTSNVESPWSDVYSFRTTDPQNSAIPGLHFSILSQASVKLKGQDFVVSPAATGMHFSVYNFDWVIGTWCYRVSKSGRIAFYDAPSGGNLVGSISIPFTEGSEFANTWANGSALKNFPAAISVNKTYYVCIEGRVYNMVQYNTGSVTSEAPIPTRYVSATERQTLIVRDFPDVVPASILNFAEFPLKTSNSNLLVNNSIFFENYGLNAFIDFEIYNGATLVSTLTIGSIGDYQNVWDSVNYYKNAYATEIEYTIKARWRFSTQSSKFYPSGFAIREWTTIKA